MKAATVTLIALTLLFAISGIKLAWDSPKWSVWLGALAPAALTLYMAIRVSRDLNRDNGRSVK